MTEITLTRAAEILGVSHQRAATMARDGAFGATTRIGKNVMLSAAAVHRVADAPRRRGRPLQERLAWAALNLLSGRAADWATPTERTRLRHLLRRSTADDLPHLMRNRSRTSRYRTVGDLNGLRRIVVPTGRAASPDLLSDWGIAPVALDQIVEGYVKADQLTRIEERFGLIPDESGAVVLRAVTVPEPFRMHDAPGAAVALDLIESPTTRERAAGRDELTRLLARFLSDVC